MTTVRDTLRDALDTWDGDALVTKRHVESLLDHLTAAFTDVEEFRVTFGQQYPREPHPSLPTVAHRDGWVTVLASDYEAARAAAVALLGTAWSGLYAAEDDGAWELYPKGELLRIVAP